MMNTTRCSFAFRVACRLATLLFLAATGIPAFAAPGDLDRTFGSGGRVFTAIPSPGGHPGFSLGFYYPIAESIVVQPDGRILVSGRFWEDGISYWYGTFIVRYMPEGTLDSSFGTNGMVAVIGQHAVGADMALQPDGKIVLIGQVAIAEGIIVQRYTSTGQLDTTFGDDGITIVRATAFEEGTSIAIQPDGKIVGVGWEYNHRAIPYYSAILLFRLNTDGSPDTTFGQARTGRLLIEKGYDGATVLVQQDGKIVVVGTLLIPQVSVTLLIARYNPDGSLDSSFGTGGRVVQAISGANFFSAGAMQADGKIVVAAGSPSIGLLRFNSDGTPDTSFGMNGIVRFESAFQQPVILMQADGRIIVTGSVPNTTTRHDDFAVTRLHPDGLPDVGFGTGGRAVFSMNAGGTNYANASAAALQADGKILVTGYFGHYYTDSHEEIAIIRVLSMPDDPYRSRRRGVRR